MQDGSVRIQDVDVAEQMQQAYIDYAMSVITSRALPDVRDGLLPVQRRILYAMHVAGNTPDRAFRKSAKTVGEVIGNYHPHGELSVYDSLVRLAQDFAMRYPLVEGHGNFGSIDGDPPAAMRYTEARLSRLAGELLRDLDKQTVDFVPNYDEQTTEPVVLPARFPNLLCNGATGIAVGMSTNIPPHNLREVVRAAVALIDDPQLSSEDLLPHVSGPDFPTGGLIIGRQGIREAYLQGHGTIVVRAKATIESGRGGRQQIVVTEIPYQTRKSTIIERIAELYREKRLDGISDITDASDRHGLRLVIELQRGADAQVLLNKLYRDTPLQQNYGIRFIALVRGRPRMLSLRDMLLEYIAHQREVIRRRSAFELERAERRLHIVQGLLLALDRIDQVITIIRSSSARAEASARLQRELGLTEVQAEAILDMRLAQLTGLERDRLEAEAAQLAEQIERLRRILGSEAVLMGVVKAELQEVGERYGDGRRTQILDEEPTRLQAEDLVPDAPVVVTLTRAGYCKRTPLDAYRNQGRGGRGIAAVAPRDDDFVTDVFTATTHDHVLFFTSAGRVFQLRVYEIPEGQRAARGTALVNLLPLADGERVSAMIPIARDELQRAAAVEPEEVNDTDDGEGEEAIEEIPTPGDGQTDARERFLLVATARGRIKRLRLGELSAVRRTGMTAIRLLDGDELIGVHLCSVGDDVLLASQRAQAVRFQAAEVRSMGRSARGVAAMRLEIADRVVAMDVLRHGGEVLLVTAGGMGKRTPAAEFPRHHRAGGGVRAQRLDERTGPLVGARLVTDGDEVVLITAQGRLIRQRVSGIPVQSRAARGVALVRTDPGDPVVALAVIGREAAEGS